MPITREQLNKLRGISTPDSHTGHPSAEQNGEHAAASSSGKPAGNFAGWEIYNLDKVVSAETFFHLDEESKTEPAAKTDEFGCPL